MAVFWKLLFGTVTCLSFGKYYFDLTYPSYLFDFMIVAELIVVTFCRTYYTTIDKDLCPQTRPTWHHKQKISFEKSLSYKYFKIFKENLHPQDGEDDGRQG